MDMVEEQHILAFGRIAAFNCSQTQSPNRLNYVYLEVEVQYDHCDHYLEECQLKTDIDEFKALPEQAKKPRNNLKDGSLHTEEKTTGRTPLHNHEILKRTHVKKKLNESDGRSDPAHAQRIHSKWKEKVVGVHIREELYGIGSLNDVRLLQSSLEGIESPHQAEAKRVVEQESMNKTTEKNKEQVLNLARQPSAFRSSRESSPTEYTESNGEDEYINSTP
ncbi:hypothetical protein H5410_055520 [Solanum commersonii]|uniref:Uncharacterized protein n=1 Tax=Solanum commersonii TaxID=4109 RepID=A0A9J5WII8_SOLCO|nr:hypothetical protein H5410_055520 [Solanum commersonii]